VVDELGECIGHPGERIDSVEVARLCRPANYSERFWDDASLPRCCRPAHARRLLSIRHSLAYQQYRLLPPLDWGEDCEAEMYRMTALWNKLVEIDRAHTERYRAATADDPAVAELRIRDAVGQDRCAHRS
jgi:hypothetical protein